MSTTPQVPPEVDTLIREWFAGWKLGPPPSDLKITVSNRLKTALGRCRPEQPEIRLAAFLLDGPSPLLREVLCHEAAHVAVHVRFGRASKPHGPEWKSLMALAGFEPRVRIPTNRPRRPRSRKEPTAVWANFRSSE